MTTQLVADIGGTNARFALVTPESGIPEQVQTLQCENFGSPLQAIHHYLSQVNTQVAAACLAVACPVNGDEIRLTNNHWSFSKSQLQNGLGIVHLEVINDFTAAAMATTVVAGNDLCHLAPELAFDLTQQRAIIGPGTGLGVAGMLPVDGATLVLSTEGGHQSFAPENEVEDYILQYLRSELAVVSREELLSGRGLVNIHRALCSYHQQPLLFSDAESIGQAALSGDAMAKTTLEQFFEILGSVAGDCALSLGATGGVYIGGGIPPRFSSQIKRSGFRRRFENKLNFKHYLSGIATAIVMHPQPGLLGAAAYLSLHNSDN
ncbi:MAG: glucokinase [Gammaproteobacteria bacterium]|nr:glucokinase [Gammaproteobacteria bacterium]